MAVEKIKVGDYVIKNPKNWIPSDFDEWGRGIGTGRVVKPPYEVGEDEVDVIWPAGRCFETTDQLIKTSSPYASSEANIDHPTL